VGEEKMTIGIGCRISMKVIKGKGVFVRDGLGDMDSCA
jgi:hypothetical protein